MKIRSGYVSNSSSSSFVVAYDSNSKLTAGSGKKKETIITFEEFLQFIEEQGNRDWSSESTVLVADGYENTKDYFLNDDWVSTEWSKKMLEKMEESHSKYSDFAVLRIAYGDKISRRMLDLFFKLGGVISLDSEDE